MKRVFTNTSAFGLLPPQMQAEFRAQRDAGAVIIEYDGGGEWAKTNARIFFLNKVYRVVEND